MDNTRLILIVAALICMLTSYSHAEGKKCFQEVVIKNSKGSIGFGTLQKTLGEPDGERFFVSPRSLAIDSKGNIYVGDSVNYRVLKFDDKGEFLLEFKLQPPVKEIKPDISHIIQGIGIDTDGNVYVWNFFEDRVEIYDQNGRFKESVNSRDDKQRGMFAKTSKGKFSKYIYEIDSYVTDKKLPGRILYSVVVVDASGKDRKEISRCSGVELASDEDGTIYSFDYNGNIYTFDALMNVIRINPFKSM
jgi:hypothetical protein